MLKPPEDGSSLRSVGEISLNLDPGMLSFNQVP